MQKKSLLILTLIFSLLLSSFAFSAQAANPAIEVVADAKGAVLDFPENAYDAQKNAVYVTIDTASGKQESGILYVFSSEYEIADLSDSTPLLLADYMSTGDDGKITFPIYLPVDFTYGEYTVYFNSTALSEPLVTEFGYYTDAQIVELKKPRILADVQNSSNWQVLKSVVLGTELNDDEVTVNDNFEIIDPSTYYYNQLSTKDKAFMNMYKSLSSIKDFEDIAAVFAKSAEAALDAEEKKDSSRPSGGGGGGGGISSTVMSETPDTSATAAGSAKSSFSDMNKHWAENYAKALADKGVVNGYEDGTFRPSVPVTRAELAKIIVGAFGVSASGNKGFADVAESDWFASYVGAAATAGIVNGFEDGSFKPNEYVTRQDAAVMIYRAMSLTHKLPNGFRFLGDEIEIADYSSDAIKALADAKIINGDADGNFLPNNPTTRAETVALISRAADYIAAH